MMILNPDCGRLLPHGLSRHVLLVPVHMAILSQLDFESVLLPFETKCYTMRYCGKGVRH